MAHRKSQSSQPQPLLQRLWRNSQTKIWAYIQAGIGTLSYIGYVTNSGAFANVLDTIHDKPIWLPTVIALFGLITFLAHGHHDDA